uniref:ATP-dependent Clp protease proteolytic subunit n=1 Tax=Wollemia nobilis TaxID=56998 RepID=A0A0C9RPX8_9CONI
MACSACTAPPKYTPRSSFLSCSSKWAPNITRSRGRIFMAAPTSGRNESNELILPDPKLVTPENHSPVLPPLYNLLDAKMQSRSYEGERVRYSGGYRNRRRSSPPDIPSMMLDKFIVYIGMPLVSLVTELIIAQIVYLQWVDSTEPIKMYINSTGTTRADGETVALENEGFAIYDAMMAAANEIHTYAIGAAVGQAALLLAAGKKGRRYMLAHSTARLEEPRLPGTGQISAVDVKIKVEKQIRDRDMTVKLLAEHTGKSEEDVLKAMKYPRNMNPRKAIEFGLADKILWKGADNKKEAVTLEEWDKREGIEVVRPYNKVESGSS